MLVNRRLDLFRPHPEFNAHGRQPLPKLSLPKCDRVSSFRFWQMDWRPRWPEIHELLRIPVHHPDLHTHHRPCEVLRIRSANHGAGYRRQVLLQRHVLRNESSGEITNFNFKLILIFSKLFSQSKSIRPVCANLEFLLVRLAPVHLGFSDHMWSI